MSFKGSPVEVWYEAAPTDIARMKEVLHPDADFNVCTGWPNGGSFHGHREIFQDFFPGAAKSWERIKPEIDTVIEAGDTYVVHGRYVGVAKPSGVPFSLQFVHIWRVADSKLIALDQIADTAILADAIAGRGALA